MIGTSVAVTGDMLSGLDNIVKNAESVLRAGGYAGANIIRNQAIINASSGDPQKITGTLARNIIVKRRDEDSDGPNRQVYIVTVRKGKFNTEGDAFYANFVEEGHAFIKKKQKGTSWKSHRDAMAQEYGTSTVPAHPFLRPAWESLKGVVMTIMKDSMASKISESNVSK